MGEATPRTDFHQILHIRRYAGCNYLCKFWFGRIKRFGKYGGQIFESSIEVAGHPYNNSALPRSPWLPKTDFGSSHVEARVCVGLLRDSLRLYWSEQAHKLQKVIDKPHSRPRWEIAQSEEVILDIARTENSFRHMDSDTWTNCIYCWFYYCHLVFFVSAILFRYFCCCFYCQY